MDIFIDKGIKPELDMPYYGRQARVFEFFKEVVGQTIKPGMVYAETNSGSMANAFAFAKLGYKVIVNDISLYSNAIARATMGHLELPVQIQNVNINNCIDLAAYCASLIEQQGYNPEYLPSFESVQTNFEKYIEHLIEIRGQGIRAEAIYNLDLFEYLKLLKEKDTNVDIMFMDFAWPWRDGSETKEYETTADGLLSLLTGYKRSFRCWTKNNILENVVAAVIAAKKVSRYVFLSNQSSNFPDSETLEIELFEKNLMYSKRHTMLTYATNEDNLGKAKYFREYLYIIEGDLL